MPVILAFQQVVSNAPLESATPFVLVFLDLDREETIDTLDPATPVLVARGP
jgi:hypothetical protein